MTTYARPSDPSYLFCCRNFLFSQPLSSHSTSCLWRPLFLPVQDTEHLCEGIIPCNASNTQWINGIGHTKHICVRGVERAMQVNNGVKCLLFKIYFIILCVFVFSLHVCICTTWLPNAHRGQKRALDPLGLESQIVLSHYVCPGIRTCVLCNRNKCS